MLKEADKLDSKLGGTVTEDLGATTVGLMMPWASRAATTLAKVRGEVGTVEMSAPSDSQRVDKSLKASRQSVGLVGAVPPLKTSPLIKRRFFNLSQAPAPSRYQRIGKPDTS